jgi:acetolactate synthase I/II/III large subunit
VLPEIHYNYLILNNFIKGCTAMAQEMRGARLFGQILKAYGVTHLFFMDAVLRRALAEMEDTGIKRILGHSEKAVAYMADGYARVSGRPGVCLAQSVGAANLAAAMQDPYLGHSPVVAITGRHIPIRKSITSRCSRR